MKRFLVLLFIAPLASASVTYTQVDGNLYRVNYTDEQQDGDRQEWQVVIRNDQDIAVVASEMEQNYLLRGSPSAYVKSAQEILNEARDKRIDEVRQEGLRRVQLYEPGTKNFDILKLIADMWPGLTIANLTGDIVTAKQIYVEAKAAIQWLNDAARTQAELDAYDVTTDPGWSG